MSLKGLLLLERKREHILSVKSSPYEKRNSFKVHVIAIEKQPKLN